MMGNIQKRIVLNTFGALSFLPGLGEVLDLGRNRFAISWVILPLLVFSRWYLIEIALTESAFIVIVPLMVALLIAYPVVAIFPLARDGVHAYRDIRIEGVVPKKAFLVTVLVVGLFGWIPVFLLTVYFPLASNSGGIQREAWAYIIGLCVAVGFIGSIFCGHHYRTNLRNPCIRTMVLPFLGIHGAGFFTEGQFIKGAITFCAGIMVIATGFWILTTEIQNWPIDGLLEYYIIFWLPVAYLSLWAWSHIELSAMDSHRNGSAAPGEDDP